MGVGVMLGVNGLVKAMELWNSLRDFDFFPDAKDTTTVAPSAPANPSPGPAPSNAPTTNANNPNEGEFRDFIRRMIEIRGILKTAGIEASTVQLPQIVVIGSQSSGKSSVLEAIVGHDFLPKGNNMVTRRPLELTLVHTPGLAQDYAELPQSEGGGAPLKLHDWRHLQAILTDLNRAVPENEWVSSQPIELTVYSARVPDLCLIDLPGYIQVTSRTQPTALRDQIAALCERYIQQPNLILAVCPADVDLANAEALQACRRVDPQGLRTLGVITKLDLVEPALGARLLRSEEDYPLPLGYIGVICRPDRQQQRQELEEAKSWTNPAFAGLSAQLGIPSLRHRLGSVLEQRMAAGLGGILERVQEELAEVKYALKVEYNDRPASAEAYVSQVLGGIKAGFERVAAKWNRALVRERVAAILHDRLLQASENLAGQAVQLNAQVAALTRSGVGRAAANGLVEAILADLRRAVVEQGGPLLPHQQARDRLLQRLEAGLREQSRVAIEQVENALKPFKAMSQIECDQNQWQMAFSQISELLQARTRSLEQRLREIQAKLGKSRLRRAVQALSQSENAPEEVSPLVRETAQEAVRLHYSLGRLQGRLQHLQSHDCGRLSPTTWLSWFSSSSPSRLEERLAECPEVYLNLLCERLVEVSSLYVHFELIHEYLGPLPDALEAGGLLSIDREAFVQENPTVARHLLLQERRRALERARERLLYLRHHHQQQNKP